MANSTDYQVRVVFQTVLGNLENNARRVVTNVRQIGTAGRNAGREGSEGFELISDAADDTTDHLRNTENAATRFSNTLKTALKAAVVGYAAKKIADFGVAAVNEYGKTQKALGEVASLGLKDLESLEKAAVNFSNTWSGTTREDFISSAYDIKSGIASLSDEGVAKFTSLAGLTAKATKAATSDMTSLFATGYGIYRKFYESDDAFGQAFSAGIAKSVQQFKTDGVQMAGSIEALGASASSANVPLQEQLSILGMLQSTMSGPEAGTKYRAFLQSAARAGKALGLQFLDANNQLRSMPEILDQLRSKYGDTIDATEKMELTKAFGTEEAVALIDLLYSKTTDLRSNIDAVGQSIAGGTKSVEKMANAMNNGPLEKMELIKQSWANVLNVMGKQIAPGIMPGLDDLQATLIDLQNSGDFTRLGESLGKLVQAGTQLFTQVLDRAPDAINALADAAQWLADNIDLVTTVVKTAATAFVAFKAASAIAKVFNVVGSAVSKVIGLFRGGTGAIAALKTALKTGLKSNWIGIVITLVISLVTWFFKATEGVTGFKDKCNAAWYDIGIQFNKLISGLMGGLKKFLGFFGAKWKWVDNLIAGSERRIADLEGKKSALRDDNENPKGNIASSMIGTAAGQIARVMQEQQGNQSNSGGSGYSDSAGGSGGYSAGGSSGGCAATTIQDRIDAINDKYSTSVDNAEIKADLAEGGNKTAEAKSYKQAAIDYLKQQAADLLRLEGSQSGNNKTLVENARLNIMKKIQDLTQDIRDGVNKMSGDFNTPSDIVAMTKYQYLTQKGGTGTGQYFSNGNVEMYFNIKNPDALSSEQLKNYINEWAATGAMTAGNISYNQAKAMADQVTSY